MSAIHHSVIAVGDLGASLRFYRDGLGLDVLQDRKVEGDWPALFDGPSRTLHAVFLGDAHVPDVSAGVLELIDFPDSSIPTWSSDPAPTTGLFQLSFHPRFSRNLGSGESLATAATFKTAHQGVFHDPTHPSALHLPEPAGGSR